MAIAPARGAELEELRFENTFAALGDDFCERREPEGMPGARLVAWSADAAALMGLRAGEEIVEQLVLLGRGNLRSFVVVIVLAVLLAGGVMLLTRLSARYDRVTGRPPPQRQVAPWLRSMRAERESIARKGRQLNALERIVVGCVVFAVIAFEVWFFFFAHLSLPS